MLEHYVFCAHLAKLFGARLVVAEGAFNVIRMRDHEAYTTIITALQTSHQEGPVYLRLTDFGSAMELKSKERQPKWR
jgi:hypothetical protein